METILMHYFEKVFLIIDSRKIEYAKCSNGPNEIYSHTTIKPLWYFMAQPKVDTNPKL